MPAAELALQRSAPAVPQGRLGLAGDALSLMPLPVLAAVAVGPEPVRTALLQSDPDAMGLPFLVVIVAVTLTWTLAGVLVRRHAVTVVWQTITLLLFTVPATMAAVVWPLFLLGQPIRG
jgi:hypothetical protein